MAVIVAEKLIEVQMWVEREMQRNHGRGALDPFGSGSRMFLSS